MTSHWTHSPELPSTTVATESSGPGTIRASIQRVQHQQPMSFSAFGLHSSQRVQEGSASVTSGIARSKHASKPRRFDHLREPTGARRRGALRANFYRIHKLTRPECITWPGWLLVITRTPGAGSTPGFPGTRETPLVQGIVEGPVSRAGLVRGAEIARARRSRSIRRSLSLPGR